MGKREGRRKGKSGERKIGERMRAEGKNWRKERREEREEVEREQK